MTIELLYFDGCPNSDEALKLIRRVASTIDVDSTIDLVKVETPEAAEAHRFLGSPTVRIDGVDIDPAARDAHTFGLTCRKYGSSGVPPEAMVVEALKRAARTKEE